MKRWAFLLLAVYLQAGDSGAIGWEVNPADFEFTATVTAVVYVDGAVVEGEDNLVAAFVGEECRGVSSPVRALDTWVFFLTLYANASGEAIRFEVYIAAEDAVVEVDEVIAFQANEVYGDPIHPVELHARLERPVLPVISGVFAPMADVPAGFLLSQSYPNPFNQATRIAYGLPGEGRIELAVFNLQGQKVRSLIAGWWPAGTWQTTWDGCDDDGRPMPSGLYLYRIDTGNFRAVRKALLVR